MTTYITVKYKCIICDLPMKSWGRARGHIAAERMGKKRMEEKIEKHERSEQHITNLEIEKYINFLETDGSNPSLRTCE